MKIFIYRQEPAIQGLALLDSVHTKLNESQTIRKILKFKIKLIKIEKIYDPIYSN